MKKLLIFLLFPLAVFGQELQLPYSVRVLNPKPLDANYYHGGSPYSSTSDVTSTIPLSIRYKGLTVNVNQDEYWFKDGVTNGDLVLKGVAGANFWPLSGETPLLGNTYIDGDNHSLRLGYAGSPLFNFNSYSTNGFNFQWPGSHDGASLIFASSDSEDEALLTYSYAAEQVTLVQQGTGSPHAVLETITTPGTWQTTASDDSGSTFWAIGPATAFISGSNPTFAGWQYGADYSTNFVARSLVDKEYVDTHGGGGGGWPLSGSASLTGDVAIDGIFGVTLGNSVPLTNFVTAVGDFSGTFTALQMSGTSTSLEVSDISGSITTLDLTLGNASINNFDIGSGSGVNITFQATAISTLTTDWEFEIGAFSGTVPGTFHGITYHDDYSANFTSHSLVDKAYVDAVAGGVGSFWPLSGSATATSNVTINNGANYVLINSNDGAGSDGQAIFSAAQQYLTAEVAGSGEASTLALNANGTLQLVTSNGSHSTEMDMGSSDRLWLNSQNGLTSDATALAVYDNRVEVTSTGTPLGLIVPQYRLLALNTDPSSSTDTGTTGEIRFSSTYIYLCVATDTWVRSALSTF